MTNKIIEVEGGLIDKWGNPLPVVVAQGGAAARFAWEEFFEAEIENDNTHQIYRRAVVRFLTACEQKGIALNQISPGEVGRYIKQLKAVKKNKQKAKGPAKKIEQPASKKMRKQHLAALRKFFDTCVRRHAIVLNPALSVKGPKEDESEGKTPMIKPEQVRAVFDAIDVGPDSAPHVIGRRDRAIIGVLAYTGCRAGAIARLVVGDYFSADGKEWFLHITEKNGRKADIPVRHDLHEFLEAYLTAAGVDRQQKEAPLFRAGNWRSGPLSDRPMNRSTVTSLVNRRLEQAGLDSKVLHTHSFRAAVATDLLNQGVALEDVQDLLLHKDPRTTRLYFRGKREVKRNIVERISH